MFDDMTIHNNNEEKYFLKLSFRLQLKEILLGGIWALAFKFVFK